jgi:hypothetical protein
MLNYQIYRYPALQQPHPGNQDRKCIKKRTLQVIESNQKNQIPNELVGKRKLTRFSFIKSELVAKVSEKDPATSEGYFSEKGQ